MPLPMPRLDNRTFYYSSTRAARYYRASRRAGPITTIMIRITLIDLLAWLVETKYDRLDRTSQASYRAFLRLVGIEPQSPQAAKTILIFSASNPSVKVAAGALVANTAGSVKFQTTRDLIVSTAQLMSGAGRIGRIAH